MKQVSVEPLSNSVSRLDVVNPESERGFKLRVHRSLRLQRKLATCIFVVVALLIIVYGLTRRPQYMAQSLVYIQPGAPKVLTDTTSAMFEASRYDSYIDQQLQTIVRDDVLSEAIKNLPPSAWQMPAESIQSAVARLRAALSVRRLQSSFEVGISLTGPDPAIVTRVVNEVTKAFLKNGRGDETAQTDRELQLLIADRRQIEEDLDHARQDQARMSSSLGVADPSSESTGTSYDNQLEQLRQQVLNARQAHITALAQLEAAIRGESSNERLNSISDELASSDPGLASLKSSITQRRSVLTTQMAGLTPLNPIYKQDERELERLDDSLNNLSQSLRAKASQQLVGKFKLEVAKTESVQSQLEEQLAQQTSKVVNATPKLQHASEIGSDIERLQARFTQTDNAIHSLELLEDSMGVAHLSLAASQPQTPVGERKIIILLAALPLAFVIAVLAAVVANKIDQRVYIAEDIESLLRFPPIAALPAFDDVGKSVMNEFMLRLVSGIDQAHRTTNAKSFVFTSASPGLDITKIVDLLAERLSVIGYKVVVAKGSSSLNGLAIQPIKPVESKGQRIWGIFDELPELPRTDQNQFMETLMMTRESTDILLINARPILVSAETEFDARLMDVTVLMVGSGLTTRRELERSTSLLRRLSSHGLATVLTDVRLRYADRDFLNAVSDVQSRRQSSYV
jgi:succinoglycan biosynthesis transport protein ExoP